MQRATLGRSGSEAALQLSGRIVRVFCSNNFNENHGNDCCYSIYSDISTIVCLSNYHNKSLMTILAFVDVFFYENGQT